MARTPSNMIPLGFEAPDFVLPDVISGSRKTLSELSSDKATVIMFICNHCPFVKHIMDELIQLGNDYIPQGISFIAINANDVENYPEDAPDKMKSLASDLQMPYPYLYDESQEVALAYQAACTPDFYIFDGAMKCVYRGQLDGSRPGNDIPVTGKDMREALDLIVAGKEVPADQIPSIGCNIKWKQ